MYHDFALAIAAAFRAGDPAAVALLQYLAASLGLFIRTRDVLRVLAPP